jgi:hypothetical protein
MPHRAHNKVSIVEVGQRLCRVHGERVVLDATTYINMGTKARFIDVDYGEWWAVVGSVLNGHGNPKRGVNCRVQKQTMSIDEG